MELRVKLFVRSNHNIILTEDGMLLKRRAQEILSLADRTRRDFLYTVEKLVGQPLISPAGNIAESNLGRWFGSRLSEVRIVARGNLLYNEALLAQKDIGMIPGIRLSCHYDRLRFVPLSPVPETTTALAWKKEQVFSTASAAFIEFANKYIQGITHNDK